MDPDNVSCRNTNSNFVLETIALELMGHEFFREFHLHRHVCTIKCYQRLVATIAQKSIVPYYLSEQPITRDWLARAQHSRWGKHCRDEYLPLCIQDKISHPRKARTISDMFFHPPYPGCEPCCAQCHKLLKSIAHTANALGQRLLA